MSLHILDLLGVTNDLKQVLVTDEVESRKVRPLLLQVLTESFLDVLQRGGEVAQCLLKILDLDDLKHNGLLVDRLHQTCEVVVDVLELCELVRKHRLDVS